MGDKSIREKEAEPLQKTGQTMADTIIAFLNKSAGNGSKLKINLENVTVGAGGMQAKINGKVAVEANLAK